MEVASFDEDGQAGNIRSVADALTKCSTITSTEDGQTAEITMTGLSFPNLGDQTLALRMNVKMGEIEPVSDGVFVAVVLHGRFQPMKGAELVKIARAADLQR